MLAKTAPKFVDAFVKILNSVVDGLIKLPAKVPRDDDWFDRCMISSNDNQDKISSRFDFLLALLKGINRQY